MSRPGANAPHMLTAVLVLATLLAGCAATPGDSEDEARGPEMPRLEGGLLSMSGGEGHALHLEEPGWARVRLESSTSATYQVHATRMVDGALGDMMQPPVMAPNEYLSLSVFTPNDEGDLAPISDMMLWGYSEELRNHSGEDRQFGFFNMDSAQLGGDAYAVAVIATNMEDMVLVVGTGDGIETAEHRLIPTLVHPRLLAQSVPEGEASRVVSEDLVAYEDRVDFPDQVVTGRGWDLALAWQATEGGPRFASVTEELGHRDATGACTGEGFAWQPYFNPNDPTARGPAVHLAAAKLWYGERDERPICAAVVASVIGDWERLDSGAWFLHVPLDPPPAEG